MQPLMTTLPKFLLIFSERGKNINSIFLKWSVSLDQPWFLKILLERFLLKEERVNA